MEGPKRKRNRLAGYDYSSCGAYFVTICTKDRLKILSKICRGGALLHPIGDICKLEIERIQNRFHIMIDKYVIMPNHVHMIIVIGQERAEQSPAPTVGDIICAFKSITTKTANKYENQPGRKIWQRSYHDHIIRNEQEYQKIWNYIDANPMKWDEDCYR